VKEFDGFERLQPKTNFRVFIVNNVTMKKSRDLFEMFNVLNNTSIKQPVEGRKRIIESKYKTIGARTFMEALELNGFSIDRKNDTSAKTAFFDLGSDTELTEEISYEFEDKGGIIVFSVNVNAVQISKNKLINSIKNNIETLKNKLFRDKKIDNVLSQHPEVYGITLGNYVKGRYRAENGSMFEESSLSVEIIGVSTEILNKVAVSLAQSFRQETVLVKNYEDNRIYLVK
jgi:hypothetical protein